MYLHWKVINWTFLINFLIPTSSSSSSVPTFSFSWKEMAWLIVKTHVCDNLEHTLLVLEQEERSILSLDVICHVYGVLQFVVQDKERVAGLHLCYSTDARLQWNLINYVCSCSGFVHLCGPRMCLFAQSLKDPKYTLARIYNWIVLLLATWLP